MKEPLWLKREWVDAIHFQQLKRFGGLFGVRDGERIESALARPIDRWHYGKRPDLARLAAAYGFGLAQNHGYVDGNKRVAFVAMVVFLMINGQEITASEPEVVVAMLGVASGEIGEEELAGWLRLRITPLVSDPSE